MTNKYSCQYQSKVIEILLVIIISMMVSACVYTPISGTVVDADTGTPIEGAVVLVEWTKTKGFGNTYTESFKVIENLTDKNGKFHIKGLSDSSVNKPDLTIYKKGYVAWNNQYIFPNDKKRPDFKWKDGLTYKLEIFDEKKYSYENHTFFLHSSTHASMGDKPLMSEAYRWEELRASKERDEMRHRQNGVVQ